MSLALAEPHNKSLKDAALKEKLQELRRTDNVTNLYYLLRTYFYLAVVLGGAVGFDLYRQSLGWSWAASVPVFFLATIFVGAGQHQLSGLAHEGSHHILFRNRIFNELASDVLCLFPLFSSTHFYRLQHLAHHQFVNDPLRDPDVSQLQSSGHWLPFPMAKKAVVWELLKQLWPLNLFRFMRIRAAYNATGTDKNPYMRKGQQQPKIAIRVAVLYLLSLVSLLAALVWYEETFWLLVLPPVLFAALALFYITLPAAKYQQSRLHCVITSRWSSVLHVGYITLVFCSLAWIQLLTGQWAAVYYFCLWLVPLFTSFAFFMILRSSCSTATATAAG